MTETRGQLPKRKTIAVLGAQLSRVWGGEFMAGVLNAARANDVNVVFFMGGKPAAIGDPLALDRSYGFYDLVKPQQLDGILIAADVVHGLSQKEVQEFCQFFAPLPMASFAIQAQGISSVIADNYGGMRAIVKHLIEEHKFQRIAFIRGPEGQIEAEQRYSAFLDELKAHNIYFDKHLLVDGDYSTESGRAAIRTLLDERGMAVQAIVASNDRMAFGLLEALQQRGINVPDKIAITGFDDVSEAQSMGVPLTTVRQSFEDAGMRAFETLMSRINGTEPENVDMLPSNLVVRWSCGCLPETIHRSIILPRDVARTGRLENKRHAAILALLTAIGIPEGNSSKDLYVDVFGRTWDVFLASLRDTDKSDAFLKMVQISVETLLQHGFGFNACHDLISTFRKYALGGISSNTTTLRAENLFQQARMLVGELSQRAQAYRRLQFEKQEELLNNFSFSMASAMSLDAVGDAIARHFPILGLERWYVMFYGDVDSPESVSSPPPQDYRILMQYEERQFNLPNERAVLGTGRLTPRGKTPEKYRYDAVVMPLSLGSNRFGFMWAEMGPDDWDIYVRVRNLLSSALLRISLVLQRERAQKEVERLLSEAHERAGELVRARDVAEKAAAQNAMLFGAEQERRRGAEALARSVRQLASLKTVEKLPEQILEQFNQVLPYERGILFMEDVNGLPNIQAQRGLPQDANLSEFRLGLKGADLYTTIVRKGETLLVPDVNAVGTWTQPDWLPRDRSWMGVPLYSKDNVVGLLLISRAERSFTEDDGLLATTFALQATVALENARLYHEVTDMNHMMERMVSERVEELNKAYMTLEKHDKNKSAFIQVAAHELRTPLTVIKGYLGMLKSDAAVQKNPLLVEALEGVLRGTERLHQIVNSMLDVVRLESQVIVPRIESVNLGLILRLIHKDYVPDLADRNLTLTLDETLKEIPPLLADPDLLKKALDQVIVNAIKFTPDGGTIIVSAHAVDDPKRGRMAEIAIKDSGIGINPEHHKVIFEKLYQLGEVQLHSSSRTNFKGGGAGLGLAIASGIVRALQGSIWVESEKRDEEACPG
ncbi:MAG TPA: substrate-binding domain-containing protein, partial [Anaerolineales bacterium]|nr:substrate-binding domain-containing protein [Anaerolineales bacterium]